MFGGGNARGMVVVVVVVVAALYRADSDVVAGEEVPVGLCSGRYAGSERVLEGLGTARRSMMVGGVVLICKI